MVDEKVFGLLGLAARAGQLVSGDSTCLATIRSGQATLVLLDAGASENTRKKYDDACAYRAVPLYIVEAGRLGHAIGRPERMVAVVKSGSLAHRLQASLPPL